MKSFSKKLIVVLCLLVCMSFVLTGCGSSSDSSGSSDSSASAPAAGTKAFEDTKYGISFNYPEKWEFEKSDGMIAAYANKDPQNLFTFNIIAKENTEKITDFSSVAKEMEDSLKTQFENGKVDSNKSVKVAGCNGIKIEYTGEISGLKMKNSSLVFGNEKNIFVVTVAATESGYDKNASDMKDLEKSIKLK